MNSNPSFTPEVKGWLKQHACRVRVEGTRRATYGYMENGKTVPGTNALVARLVREFPELKRRKPAGIGVSVIKFLLDDPEGPQLPRLQHRHVNDAAKVKKPRGGTTEVRFVALLQEWCPGVPKHVLRQRAQQLVAAIRHEQVVVRVVR